MSNLCDKLIAKDIDFACDEMSVRGLEADGLIINRNDIDFGSTVFSSQNPNIIETLVLKEGKRAYKVVQLGNTPFTGVASNLTVGTYVNTWTHDIPIAVLANDPGVAKDIIDPLANGSYVLILKNKNKGVNGNGEYQVFGYNQGCRASAGVREAYSEDTEGGWLMTLQETNAPKSAIFFFKTDSATTEAMYNSLLEPEQEEEPGQ